MSSFGEAYRDARERLSKVALSADDAALERRVPACPEWTVKELVAHVTGIAADMIAGDVFGAGQPEWTSRQIADRRDKSIAEIVDEWAEVGVQLEGLLDGYHPAVGSLTVGDLVTHEHDALGALGRREARDTNGVALALDGYVRRFGRRIKDAGLPGVRLIGESGSLVAGKDEPTLTVKGGDFELLRGLTGRRTKDEIRALEWSGEPEPYVEIFSAYDHPAAPLGE